MLISKSGFVHQVRTCLKHFHITSCGYDLIYGPFKTEEEAWAVIEELEKENGMASK